MARTSAVAVTRVVAAGVPVALVAMLILAATGCGGNGHRVAARDERPPIAVEAIVLDTSATGALVLPARIKAREEVAVTARVAGRVTALLAREGQRVRAGEPLARFDAPESRGALAAARREHDAAVLAAEVARRQQARIESLHVARVAAPRDRELADSERRAAEARLESTSSALESLAAALEMRAPFAGLVARRHVDAGADVQPGTPLFTVRSIEGTEVMVPVPEAALPALPSARFAFQVGEGGWRPARLERLDGMTDFGTRTRIAHLVPAHGPDPEPGAFARVRLESPDLPEAPLPQLPVTSLVRRGALTGVFVIEDGRAVLRWLKLGREQAGTVEVISGLFPGERVARRSAGLADGVPVRVETPADRPVGTAGRTGS